MYQSRCHAQHMSMQSTLTGQYIMLLRCTHDRVCHKLQLGAHLFCEGPQWSLPACTASVPWHAPQMTAGTLISLTCRAMGL